MQSQRKFRKPKREKVNALAYAQGFLMSVSASADTRQEAIDKAAVKALEMSATAFIKALDPDIKAAEAKEWTRTGNFWNNIAGHIPKVKYK